jgi:hypothetical protein
MLSPKSWKISPLENRTYNLGQWFQLVKIRIGLHDYYCTVSAATFPFANRRAWAMIENLFLYGIASTGDRCKLASRLVKLQLSTIFYPEQLLS